MIKYLTIFSLMLTLSLQSEEDSNDKSGEAYREAVNAVYLAAGEGYKDSKDTAEDAAYHEQESKRQEMIKELEDEHEEYSTLRHCDRVVDIYLAQFLGKPKTFWYCKACGKGNLPIAKYCTGCGKKR